MPIVDDPFDFGRIAATNALSDVYAMGGTPIMALAIVGMPINKLSVETIRAILQGGESVCEAAGIPLAGGLRSILSSRSMGWWRSASCIPTSSRKMSARVSVGQEITNSIFCKSGKSIQPDPVDFAMKKNPPDKGGLPGQASVWITESPHASCQFSR